MNKKSSIFLSAAIVLCALIIVAIYAARVISNYYDNAADNSSLQSGELRVDFIDVGKGDCILIRSQSHTVMIDTGYKDTTDIVFDFLDSSGISEIDTLILTHYDKDHIGGAKKLLTNYPVKKLYIPDYQKDSKKYKKLIKAIDQNDIDVECVSARISFTADNAIFSVMPSGVEYNDKDENDNDMSLLVSVVYSDDSYLFTGDIQEAGINCLLDRIDRTYDILKIPHHGRMENNSKDLIEGVNPEYAIITDDNDNSADPDICSLLSEKGIKFYSTSGKGTVTIVGNGSGIYSIQTQKP